MRFVYNKNKLYFYLLSFIFLLGLSLRIYNLGTSSLWFDEAKTIIYSTGDRGNILSQIKLLLTGILKGYPSPLYEVFIYYWKYLGSDEFTLRLPSVIFSVTSILAIYYLGKLFFNRKVGLFSAFILAISPFHIYYAQEARVYSFIILFTVMTVYFLKRFLESGRYIFLIGYTIFHIFNIYAHYMTVFILFAEIIFFGLYWRRYKHLLIKWLISHFLILLTLVPWLMSIILQLKHIPIITEESRWLPSWLPSISLKNIFITFRNFNLGYNASSVVHFFGFLLFFFFFIFGVIKQKNKEGLILLLCCLFIPISTIFIVSKFKVLYVDRHLIPSSIFYYIIVASGLIEFKKRYITFALAFIIILSSFALRNYYMDYLPYSFFYHVGVPKKIDHRQAARYIINNFHKGDMIFHTCEDTVYPFMYYFNIRYSYNPFKYIISDDGDKEIVLLFSKYKNRPVPFRYDITANFVDISNNISIEGHKRIWLIASAWDFKFFNDSNSSESKVIKWMDEHYSRIEAQRLNGINIYLYINKQL